MLYGDLTADTDLHGYYPGDDVVDWVALDGYNFGDNHSEWHRWQSFDAVFGPSIAAMAAYDKPLMLAEIGSADDPRKAQWLDDCLRRIEEDQRVQAAVFFHYDKRREHEHNWRLDSDPESLRVFRNWADGVGPASQD